MRVVPHQRVGVYSALEIVQGVGAELIDRSGRRLLDLTSGFGVAALGYSCGPVAEAVRQQMLTCSHAIPSLIGYRGEEKAAELILGVTGVADGVVCLTTSGAEAIEVARKIAYLATGKPDVVTLAGAYHGQSLGSLSLTGHRALRASLETILGRPGLILPTPTQGTLYEQSMQRCIELLGLWLDSLDQGNPQVGAVLVEPMQNLAGYRFFGHAFGAAVSSLCRQKGVILIADEVFTGCGRTGEWTLSATAGYTPDIICLGKALTGGVPGGACVASRDLVDLLFPSGQPPLHAPTFYGSPVVNAAIAASLTYLSEMELVQRASRIGVEMLETLRDLRKHGFVIDVRGRGAAIAVEFRDDPDRTQSGAELVMAVVRALLNRGVLALNSGFPRGNVLLICPPLIISDSQIERAINAVAESVAEVA